MWNKAAERFKSFNIVFCAQIFLFFFFFAATAIPVLSIASWLVGHRLRPFEEEEGQSYHYSDDNQSQWKKVLFITLNVRNLYCGI